MPATPAGSQAPKVYPAKPFSGLLFGACIAGGVGLLFLLGSVSAFLRGCDFDGKRAQATRQLRTIKEAIAVYRLHSQSGKLPEPAEIPHALFESGPRGEPPPLDAATFMGGKLLDPWGHEYVYLKHSDRTFEFISYGSDGEPGGEGAAADISTDDNR